MRFHLCKFIRAFGRWIGCEPCAPVDKARIILVLSFPNQITIYEATMARISNTQEVSVELKPVNRKGGAAAVEPGTVAWSSSDESVITVEVDPENELKAKVVAVGAGVAQVTVTADADLDEGEVREISGSTAIEVVPAEADTFELIVGEPQEQP